MRAGSQKKWSAVEEQLALPRIVLAVPFPAVRHVTYWLDRPQPAPGWGRLFERSAFQNYYSPDSSANSITRKSGPVPDKMHKSGLGSLRATLRKEASTGRS
jgi:hypothetical protein